MTFISLFAFPVPKLVPETYVAGDKLDVPQHICQQTAVKKERNLVPGRTATQRFLRHFASVLSCKHVLQSCNPPGDRRNIGLYRLTRAIFCVFAWNAYFIQLCFPFLTIVAMLMVLSKDGYCYLHLGPCILLKYSDSGDSGGDLDL